MTRDRNTDDTLKEAVQIEPTSQRGKHVKVAQHVNTWFTSDEHVSHANIIKYAGRPFDSVEKMNRMLIEYHNAVVAPEDIVYHLGDFAFCQIDKIKNHLSQLNGSAHYLCVGNHDREIIKYRQHLIDGGYFKDIRERIEITIEKQFIVLHHYALRVWNKSHHGSWALWGHSHGSLPAFAKSCDVGVDSPHVTGQAEYRPFSFAEIKRFMDKQSIVTVDHHGRKDKHND